MFSSKFSFACILVLLLMSLQVYAQPSEVPMSKKQGYFFSGQESMLEDKVNCFVVTELKEFEKFFGTRRSDTPAFHKEWMLIMVMPSTKKDITLDFSRISMKAGSFIEVYCDLNNLKGKKLTYETNPMAVCTIPKYDKIKVVNFYEERKNGLELIEKVNIKSRR